MKWSNSTVSLLRQCGRKFFFANILANYSRKDKLKRKAFELKQMQDIRMWQGSVVDKIMETKIIPAIANKQTLDFELFAEQAIDLAKRRFRFSKEKWYLDDNITKTDAGEDFCILDIHESGTTHTEEEIQIAYDNIRNSILNIPNIIMPNNKTFLLNYLKNAGLLIPNITTWQVAIEDALVKPQIDLVLYSNNAKPTIIDWKVSDSWVSDYAQQLEIIGLLVYLKRLENPDKEPFGYEDIKLFEVNLFKGAVKEHAFTDSIAADTIDYINLTSSDIKLIKKEIKDDSLTIKDFDTTDNQSTCEMCNFKPLCSFLIKNKFQYDENTYFQSLQVEELA